MSQFSSREVISDRDPLRHVRVGCAGWSIPAGHAALFPVSGSHLVRYSACFTTVEINSSFYRPHRRTTYARWAASVPEDFTFTVKVPKEITHTLRLVGASAELTRFLSEVGGLERKLGALLIQLPPSLRFDNEIVTPFFETLRAMYPGEVACEPRHESWFNPQASDLLAEFQVGRVAADPAVTPAAANVAGSPKTVYYRLHGSPRMYYSCYSSTYLDALIEKLLSHSSHQKVWCIFDNTAAGAAIENALDISSAIHSRTMNQG